MNKTHAKKNYSPLIQEFLPGKPVGRLGRCDGLWCDFGSRPAVFGLRDDLQVGSNPHRCGGFVNRFNLLLYIIDLKSDSGIYLNKVCGWQTR